jgi:hypothetical protein
VTMGELMLLLRPKDMTSSDDIDRIGERQDRKLDKGGIK